MPRSPESRGGLARSEMQPPQNDATSVVWPSNTNRAIKGMVLARGFVLTFDSSFGCGAKETSEKA